MKIAKTGKKMCRLVAVVAALWFVSPGVEAQVTMGQDHPPVEGALLQLTNMTEKPDQSNATKGLLLPRVTLTSLSLTGTNLATIVTNALSTDVWNKDEHVGMVVYHIKGSTSIQTGIYVWTGDEWLPVKAS